MPENILLTNIFKTGDHDSAVHVSTSVQNTLTMRLAGRMARMGKMSAYRILLRGTEEVHNFLNLGIGTRIVLKWNFTKYGERLRSGDI